MKTLHLKYSLILTLAVFVSSCSTTRPENNECNNLIYDQNNTNSPLFNDLYYKEKAGEIANSINGKITPTGKQRNQINLLIMSAGGQYVSFGAGFLQGWHQNQKKPPSFNIITGVSAGSILAPVISAGQENKEVLEKLSIFDGVESKDLITRNQTLFLPFSHSIYNVSKTEKKIKNNLGDQAVIKSLQKHFENNRFLFLGSVDINSGKFKVFDIGRFFSSENNTEKRINCLKESMLASSAIPVAFPPRHINNNLYVDGGTRKHVFLANDETILDEKIINSRSFPLILLNEIKTLASLNDKDIEANIYLIINGDLTIQPFEKIKVSMIDLLTRNMTIATDELLRQSTLETILFAEQKGINIYAVTAKGVSDEECHNTPEIFDKNCTKKLFKEGYNKGLKINKSDWLSASELKKQISDY